MSEIELKKFGMTLTDRADGQKAFASIVKNHQQPYVLNFNGVMSMGSSFGDEVVVRLARIQGNQIAIFNANDGIKNCISRVIEETGIAVNFQVKI